MSELKYRTVPEGEYLRIYALRDIPEIGVKAGDRGGRISHERNLSQHGYGWIFPEAVVEKHALVDYDGFVKGLSRVTGASCVYDHSVVVDSVVNDSDVAQRSVVSGQYRLNGCTIRRSILKGSGKLVDCHVYASNLEGTYALTNVSLAGVTSKTKLKLTTPCSLVGNRSFGMFSFQSRAGLIEATAFRERHDIKWEYGEHKGICTDTLFELLPKLKGAEYRKLFREILMVAYGMLPKDEFKAFRKEVQKYEV